MLKFMKKIPGGLLLIPMLISAIFYTFSPNFFDIGPVSGAFFTKKGINYMLGLICFLSATSLDLRNIKKIIRKQGSILLIKFTLSLILGILFVRFFGLDGIFGISALSFITGISSLNPALYLAFAQDYGDEDDVAAFGLAEILCMPAFSILIFSLSKSSSIDWTLLFSILIPLIFGLIIGNLDRQIAEFFYPAITIITPIMGWSFGSGINIINAFEASFQGIFLSILFYLLTLPILFFYERKILKENGMTSLGISSIAGVSTSVPEILASSDQSLVGFSQSATSQLAMGVLITSIITPILVGKFMKKRNK
ncbi:2-keto-3-deoxygluconate permease [Anaerococcus ihuae]|uniref:2-keto-3-deoxygluconate permease n=1 Tax=Anaerococcus ihuae TaxID=2899519 RepID=UPI001F48BB77|nr:2-keto-3-deoxygluconate permease [Anaerococcus ihuae]